MWNGFRREIMSSATKGPRTTAARRFNFDSDTGNQLGMFQHDLAAGNHRITVAEVAGESSIK